MAKAYTGESALTHGRQLKAARILAGLEQVELAKEAGVSLATIRRLERSNAPLRVINTTLKNLEKALTGAGIDLISGDKVGALYVPNVQPLVKPVAKKKAATKKAKRK